MKSHEPDWEQITNEPKRFVIVEGYKCRKCEREMERIVIRWNRVIPLIALGMIMGAMILELFLRILFK